MGGGMAAGLGVVAAAPAIGAAVGYGIYKAYISGDEEKGFSLFWVSWIATAEFEQQPKDRMPLGWSKNGFWDINWGLSVILQKTR